MPWRTQKSRLLIFVMQIQPRSLKLWCFLYFMNEKFNKNAKVEKLTKKVGRGVRLIVIGSSGLLAPQANSLTHIPPLLPNTGLRIPKLSAPWCFTLPFITNVMISISTSQIFRSWVAIFKPRSPMVSLFRNLYYMPGLALRMNVYPEGDATFK